MLFFCIKNLPKASTDFIYKEGAPENAPTGSQKEKLPEDEKGGVPISEAWDAAANEIQRRLDFMEAQKISALINAICDAENIEWARVDAPSTVRVEQAVKLGYDTLLSVFADNAGNFHAVLKPSGKTKEPRPGRYPWVSREKPGEITIRYAKAPEAKKPEPVVVEQTREKRQEEEIQTGERELQELTEKWRDRWDRMQEQDLADVAETIRKAAGGGKDMESLNIVDLMLENFMESTSVPRKEMNNFAIQMDQALQNRQKKQADEFQTVLARGVTDPEEIRKEAQRIYGYLPSELDN